ncbi:gp53-like domain-containing protein [Sphingomonas sp. DT-51]|uniref:gp53-like domain-containing protein n=1 Tax=Sphingomonas sp. DT-51 TaxID=3396165 RepID=UPI003F1BC548
MSATGLDRAGNRLWDAGNDGAGSGLDADLLDGHDSTDFALLTGATFIGGVTAIGGLYADNHCYLRINREGKPDLSADEGDVLRYDRVADRWDVVIDNHSRLGIAATGVDRAGNRVWDAGNDGAGSGLDADLLDGWERDDLRAWSNLLGRPAAFPPAAHTHKAADLIGAFPGALSTNGYVVLPGGLIIQWVSGAFQDAGSVATQTVTFPITFPGACTQVVVTAQLGQADPEAHAAYQLVAVSASSATVQRQLPGGAIVDRQASWPRLLALGY